MSRVLPVLLAGDSTSRLAQLFDVHYARLYRLARRLSPTIDDALDLVQETFLRAAQAPNSVPAGARDEEAWLVRVLINITHDHWRKRTIRNRYNNVELVGREPATRPQEAEDALIVRTAIWKALEILPPRRRSVVAMYELEGLTITAIASLLGISAVTVKWHLSRGRRELTRVLKPYLGYPNEKH